MDRDPRISFEGDARVYPASEDSTLLLSAVEVNPGERFLEVSMGGAFVTVHAALVTTVVASEINVHAVRLATRNAAKQHLPVHVVRCDVMSALRGPFDVVAFNAPYLEGNPLDEVERAWAGGGGASRVVLRFLQDLPRVLSLDGRVYLIVKDQDAEARQFAGLMFHVRAVASTRLFFERLDLLELCRREKRADGWGGIVIRPRRESASR